MIVKGDLDPGQRLPSQSQLQTQYATGTVTVQNALGLLARDGFIETDGTRGTFVSRFPPHLTHYGVVFPESPRRPSATWSSFWAALDAQLPRFPTRDDRKLKTYYDANEGDKSRDYRRLLSDLEHHRLAGLIFVTPPYTFRGTPVLEEVNIPRVAIMDRPEFPDVPAVYFDFLDLLRQAVKQLHAAGRQRVAIFASGPLSLDLGHALPDLIKQHRLETRPEWNQYLSPWIT
ncbi:MAG: GntR family transcriptional regulator, partial [Phycisphaeraceae bacterium]